MTRDYLSEPRTLRLLRIGAAALILGLAPPAIATDFRPGAALAAAAHPAMIAWFLALTALLAAPAFAVGRTTPTRIALFAALAATSGIAATQLWAAGWAPLAGGYRASIAAGHPAGAAIEAVLAAPGAAEALAHLAGVAIAALGGFAALATDLFTPLAPTERERRDHARAGAWISPGTIKHLGRARSGLPLGYHRARPLRYAPDERAGLPGGHHLVLAGTRAGKGTRAIIPAILDWQGPVAVLDIKGEAARACARHRRERGQEVHVLDPFGVTGIASASFNPLDAIRRDSAGAPRFGRDLPAILDGLVRREGPADGGGDHWDEMAHSLLGAAIRVVATGPDEAARTLVTVRETLFGGRSLKEVLEEWHADARVDPAARLAAATVLQAGDREFGTIQTTTSRALSWLDADEMRASVSKSSFGLDAVLDGRADLFLVMPLEMLRTHDAWLRLTVNLLLATASRREAPPKRPLLLVLDEFVRLGRLGEIENIATVGAGLGIETLFIAQDIGQVRAVYGPAADTIAAACVTKRLFGVRDPDTADWTVRMLDEVTRLAGQHRPGKGALDPLERSFSEQRATLLTPGEMMNMPPTEALLLIGAQGALPIQTRPYYADPAYDGRWDATLPEGKQARPLSGPHIALRRRLRPLKPFLLRLHNFIRHLLHAIFFSAVAAIAGAGFMILATLPDRAASLTEQALLGALFGICALAIASILPDAWRAIWRARRARKTPRDSPAKPAAHEPDNEPADPQNAADPNTPPDTPPDGARSADVPATDTSGIHAITPAAIRTALRQGPQEPALSAREIARRAGLAEAFDVLSRADQVRLRRAMREEGWLRDDTSQIWYPPPETAPADPTDET